MGVPHLSLSISVVDFKVIAHPGPRDHVSLTSAIRRLAKWRLQGWTRQVTAIGDRLKVDKDVLAAIVRSDVASAAYGSSTHSQTLRDWSWPEVVPVTVMVQAAYALLRKELLQSACPQFLIRGHHNMRCPSRRSKAGPNIRPSASQHLSHGKDARGQNWANKQALNPWANSRAP